MAMSLDGVSDSFFKDQALFGRFRLPTLIAILAGIAWGFQPIAIYYAMDAESRVNIMNAVSAEWIIHFMIPWGIWLFFWVAFYVGVKAYGGRVRVGRLFKLVGWGLAPFTLIGLVRAAGKYYAFQGVSLPHDVRRGVMSAELRGYENMLAEVGAHSAIVAATVASCLFLLLSAYVWRYAIRHSTDLEDRRVLVVIAVPTVLYALYSVANVVAL